MNSVTPPHRLVQRNPKWRDLKARLRKTKPGSVATAAVANRWVRWLFHQGRADSGARLRRGILEA